MNRFSLLVLSMIGIASAHAESPNPMNFVATKLHFLEALYSGGADDYQIGDVWAKTAVTAATLRNQTPAQQRLARATAKYSFFFGGGTGFYLGKFNGVHLMGTNHHVAEGVPCGSASITLPFLGGHGLRLGCDRVIKTWTDIDFAIVVLKVRPEDEAALEGAGVAMDFTSPVVPGEELITFGYGAYLNPGQANLMVNQDSDCRVFSGENDFRFIADPDTINPADYKAWSFSNGCDISHGDSGSAYGDRKTGKVIGIVWTAATPKTAEVRSSAWLSTLTPQNENVWTKLSYTVPAQKIRAYLETQLSTLPAQDADLVKAFITQ